MIDILLPVLGRPHNVEPLLESIIENTAGSYRIVFICSPGDSEQIQVCSKTGYDTRIVDWEPDRADFAKKINWAFGQTYGEWVFQGADDIRFSKGWDTEALKTAENRSKPRKTAENRSASVIGTNDLHNPSVKAGTHSTHMLFRRDYITKYGGTFDGSGTVFSEAYDHQWVDNEFIETAKRRGQWAFAKKAVVEHFHPVWGNNEWDDTYRKAFRESKEDQALYGRRIRQMEQAVAR